MVVRGLASLAAAPEQKNTPYHRTDGANQRERFAVEHQKQALFGDAAIRSSGVMWHPDPASLAIAE
jgi:hypothetical protein